MTSNLYLGLSHPVVSYWRARLEQVLRSLLIGIVAGIITWLAWSWKTWKETQKLMCNIPVKEQSVLVDTEGDSEVRRSPLMTEEPIQSFGDGVETLYDVFVRGLKLSGDGPCLGWRPKPGTPFQWLSYDQVQTRVRLFGSGLVKEGAKTCTDQFIGIFSQNRVEWKVTEQVCNSYSMVLVPLYGTLGPAAIEHIITVCNLKIIVVDNSVRASLLLDGVLDQKYSVDLLIIMDPITDGVWHLAGKLGVKVVTYANIEEEGKSEVLQFVPPKRDDLHTICYTSGTSGFPKGIMLTHGNLVANAAAVLAMGDKSYLRLTNEDVYLSYLPLAHVMERLLNVIVFSAGARIGYFEGNVDLLMDDMTTLRPTLLPMVPQVINKLYRKIVHEIEKSPMNRTLLRWAIESKQAKLKRGVVTRKSIWDLIILRKIQNMFGGRLRVCVTGAAPVSLDVINFMRCALGIPFTEGYGLAEATACLTVTIPGDYTSGSVGSPCPCLLIKLVDVTGYEYNAKDGEGEICVKGTIVFQGYYKDDAASKAIYDKDGWLHTGDVGMWLPNGALKILDRQKHIFKLAQGEYIVPEKVEQALVQSEPVAQVFVHGNSLKSTIVMIIVPDPDTFLSWCATRGVSEEDYETLCKNAEANTLVLDDLWAVGKRGGLKNIEMPQRIYMTSEMFTVENDLLTPTYKSKRTELYNRYKREIEEMYASIE